MDRLLPPEVSAVHQCRDKWERGTEQENEWKLNCFSEGASEEVQGGWFRFPDGEDGLKDLEFQSTPPPSKSEDFAGAPSRGPGPQALPGRGRSMISHVQVANVMFLNPLSQLHPTLPCSFGFQKFPPTLQSAT